MLFAPQLREPLPLLLDGGVQARAFTCSSQYEASAVASLALFSYSDFRDCWLDFLDDTKRRFSSDTAIAFSRSSFCEFSFSLISLILSDAAAISCFATSSRACFSAKSEIVLLPAKIVIGSESPLKCIFTSISASAACVSASFVSF